MRQQLFGRILADRAKVCDRIGNIGRVPVDDRGDDEVQARGSELLRFVRTISDAALLERANGLRQEVALLRLVEACLATPAQRGAFQPVEHEDCAPNPANLAKCEVELVLTLIGIGALLRHRYTVDHSVQRLRDGLGV
jgi:hypothetical protein